jgi:hypothetical protein
LPPVTNTGGGTGRGLSSYLAIVAVLAGVALAAGVAGLYLTRDRKLPALAGAEVPPAPLGPPAAGFYTPPEPDADHDWGSQTPGPPPPPPPPGPYENGEP